MACSITITGRTLQCKDALGGIKQVYIGLYTGHDQYATLQVELLQMRLLV